MKFKCTIELESKLTVTKYINAENLGDLDRLILVEFPKGRILCIIGDYE